MEVTASLTAAGTASDVLFVKSKDRYSFAITGTFVGTWAIQRSTDGGASYNEVHRGTLTQSDTLTNDASSDALYRVNCVAYTSGTIGVALEDQYHTSHDFKNVRGESVLKVKEETVEIPNGKKMEFTQEYDGSGSYQPVAVDLDVTGSGSDDGTDTAFIAPFMGHVTGSAVDGEGNYLAGVIGAISAAGTASDYPVGGVVGIAMQGAEGADAPVVSVIDGDDGGDPVNVRAMFAARMNNNHATSGAEYGVDLYDAGNAHYTGGPVPLLISKAPIRMPNQVCFLVGDGAPADGTTGDNFAQKGSLYVDYTNGFLYINTGTITDSTWVKVGTQS